MGILFFVIIFFLNLDSTFAASSASDYTALVYRGCSKQPLSDPTGSYSRSITNLYAALVQQSAKSKFYKSTSGSVTGLFQCRGDLSAGACYDCISRIPPMADQLCAGKVAAARVQLQGCYLLYEVSGFTQMSGMEMLFKLCSRGDAAGTGFDIKRDTAFSVMENGVAAASGGFYATTYQQVYAMGQCEGDLSSADCATCVKAAVQRAQVECGNSIAGQTYLHKCFISYSYYPNGAPSGAGSGSSSYSSSSTSSSSGTGQTTKTVAIILGGTAGVGFLIICVLFARGLKNKDDGMSKLLRMKMWVKKAGRDPKKLSLLRWEIDLGMT
ncbi:hypothetical protein V2J09_000097 [Rumex salicifolius]